MVVDPNALPQLSLRQSLPQLKSPFVISYANGVTNFLSLSSIIGRHHFLFVFML